MLWATNKKHTLEFADLEPSFDQNPILAAGGSRSSLNERRLSSSGLIASNKRTNIIVRFIYFLNSAIVIAGLIYITVAQKSGAYRCKTVTVLFDEEYWKNAYVMLDDGSVEERLLMYSYFNGIYKGERVNINWFRSHFTYLY